MAHIKLEYDCACPGCGATGLYVGFAERDGAAVVCRACTGSGKQHRVIEYDEFEGRKERGGVAQVFESNPGICLEINLDRAIDSLEAFGGMPYEEWRSGQPFPAQSENRAYTCPAWWYQGVDYEKKPNWRECNGCGAFADCESFPSKDKCWARFDAEQELVKSK